MSRPDSEDIARVMERLARARWTSGTKSDTHSVRSAWTPLGIERLEKLHEIIGEIGLVAFTPGEIGALVAIAIAFRQAR